MINVIVVVLGGGLGAIARYQLNAIFEGRASGTLPLGTLVVNVSGSLVLGLIVGLRLNGTLPAAVALAAGTGFCGAFTTFSSLMYEASWLAQQGAYLSAVRILSLNVILGSAAAAIGLWATGALW